MEYSEMKRNIAHRTYIQHKSDGKVISQLRNLGIPEKDKNTNWDKRP